MKSFFLIAIFQLFITMIFASESCKLVTEGSSGKTETEVTPGHCQRVSNGSKLTLVKLDGTSNGGYFEIYKNNKRCRGSSLKAKESKDEDYFFKVSSVYITSC